MYGPIRTFWSSEFDLSVARTPLPVSTGTPYAYPRYDTHLGLPSEFDLSVARTPLLVPTPNAYDK
jgi:hypothetical protein